MHADRYLSVKPAIRKGEIELSEKSGFYEQVIHVKGFSVFLSRRFGLFCCSVVVGPHIVLHRVSIRTLVSRPGLCADWGQKEKSMLPVFGRPRSGPNPTRSHRNAG